MEVHDCCLCLAADCFGGTFSLSLYGEFPCSSTFRPGAFLVPGLWKQVCYHVSERQTSARSLNEFTLVLVVSVLFMIKRVHHQI